MRYIATIIVLVLSTSTFGADVKPMPHQSAYPEILGIAIAGSITLGDAAKVRTIVEASPKTEVFIVIGSEGGSAAEGVRLYNYLVSLHATRNVTTIVPEKRDCASSAAIVWLAGEERVIHEGAVVMFHLPYAPLDAGKPIDDVCPLDVQYMSIMMGRMGDLGVRLANDCLDAQRTVGSDLLFGFTMQNGKEYYMSMNMSTDEIKVITE